MLPERRLDNAGLLYFLDERTITSVAIGKVVMKTATGAYQSIYRDRSRQFDITRVVFLGDL